MHRPQQEQSHKLPEAMGQPCKGTHLACLGTYHGVERRTWCSCSSNPEIWAPCEKSSTVSSFCPAQASQAELWEHQDSTGTSMAPLDRAGGSTGYLHIGSIFLQAILCKNKGLLSAPHHGINLNSHPWAQLDKPPSTATADVPSSHKALAQPQSPSTAEPGGWSTGR